LENFIFQLEAKRLEFLGRHLKHANHAADIDPLTDLYSQRLLERYVRHELDRSRRYGYAVALVIISLRNWKAVKADHGSTLANAILVNMACACRASLRGYDYLSRTDEDKFALLLPQADSPVAHAVLRRISEKFHQALKRLSPELPITLEFGTATFPFDGENPTRLFYTAMTHRMSLGPDMKGIQVLR
jgi:diguanylate cyclase (GGDEF)-like protein